MDATTDNCPGQIRDPQGWREGLLRTASADLLVAWHAATLNPHLAATSPAAYPFRDVIDDIRRARLADDLDQLETACRSLLDLTDRYLSPTSALRAALNELRRSLTSVDPSNAPICLVHGDAYAGRCPPCRAAR
jgi:hypothetical protein